MKKFKLYLVLVLCAGIYSCQGFTAAEQHASDSIHVENNQEARTDSLYMTPDSATLEALPAPDTNLGTSSEIDTRDIKAESVVQFAETLLGIPYVYAATEPKIGFDCSGFITYVFNHFNIKVPRSSVDFTDVGNEIPAAAAKRGDIILFTGTNPLERSVGHMGIVVANDDTLKFIHSTSGKAMGVTVTPFTPGYQKRFVKTLRVFTNF
ncbi:MAG: C40 family peptidase [Flavisolibacter sp.]|jgi:cell wall-associated NlpC family hydrolase|nr:C40 family peptidase [Flavisolibacter sp.]